VAMRSASIFALAAINSSSTSVGTGACKARSRACVPLGRVSLKQFRTCPQKRLQQPMSPPHVGAPFKAFLKGT
jgi:hypothetical protein